jgi:hypothetical protein
MCEVCKLLVVRTRSLTLQREWISKWDGALPSTTAGTNAMFIPFNPKQ